VIQQVEAQRRQTIEQLAEDREYCEMTLKKQLCLLKQDLECKTQFEALVVPVVSTEGIQFKCSDERFCFGELKRQRGTFRPYSVSFDRNSSYVDPVTLSGDLFFDVCDLNGDKVNNLALESKFSVDVIEPRNAACKVQVHQESSRICVSVISLEQAQSSEIELKVTFEESRLANLSKDSIISSDHVEGGVLYQGRLSGSSVLRSYPYGSELFCSTKDQTVEVYDLFGTLKRKWGSKGEGPGRFLGLMGIAVYEGKVYLADWKGDCVQVFDLEGNFIQSITIRCPRFIVIVDAAVWVVGPKEKLTIMSKEGAILAEDLDIVRDMIKPWKGAMWMFYGDYNIVVSNDRVEVYDWLRNLVFCSSNRLDGRSYSISLLPDGKMFITNTNEMSSLMILDTGLDSKRSIKFWLFKYLQQQSQKRQIEVKSFCKLILLMCTKE
jgi:hypothetical protein